MKRGSLERENEAPNLGMAWLVDMFTRKNDGSNYYNTDSTSTGTGSGTLKQFKWNTPPSSQNPFAHHQQVDYSCSVPVPVPVALPIPIQIPVTVSSLADGEIGANQNMNHHYHHHYHHHREEPSLPSSNPHPKETAALLAREMNSMSLQDRNQVLEDVHGVAKPVQETPELITQAMYQMQKELDTIHEKPAYDLAWRRSRAYVEGRRLRLMCLRAERFDAKAAANKIVDHFRGKLALFGETALARPISLEDYDANDITTLKCGCIQLLPVRDRASRAVICNVQSAHVYETTDNMMKMFWYIVMSALEDEETQRNGIVLIAYNVGPFDASLIDREVYWRGALAFRHLPMHAPGIHYCFDDPKIRAVSTLVSYGFGPKCRARLRVHDGTDVECRYRLLSFGIPVEYLPITDTGALKNINHMKWFARRKHKEAVNPYGSFLGIDLPTNRDVLIGRGKPFQHHPGNETLHNIVEANRNKYESRKRGGKSDITEGIVHDILQQPGGGRFLKRDESGWWIVANLDEAQQKVSHSFRTKRCKGSTEARSLGSSALPLGTGKRVRIKIEVDSADS